MNCSTHFKQQEALMLYTMAMIYMYIVVGKLQTTVANITSNDTQQDKIWVQIFQQGV